MTTGARTSRRTCLPRADASVPATLLAHTLATRALSTRMRHPAELDVPPASSPQAAGPRAPGRIHATRGIAGVRPLVGPHLPSHLRSHPRSMRAPATAPSQASRASGAAACDQVCGPRCGAAVERSWTISVEDSRTPVTHPVARPVDPSWTNFGVLLVHNFGVCHPPLTVDVRPTWCARENSMTPGGWRLTHTVHRDY